MTAVTPMKAHPYADAWPMLQGDDLADLAADIAENGLRDPVVLYRGMILDGRNRHAACQQVGAAVNFTDFDGDDDAASPASGDLRLPPPARAPHLLAADGTAPGVGQPQERSGPPIQATHQPEGVSHEFSD